MATPIPESGSRRAPKLPPGPGLPALAQTLLWIRRPVELMEWCQRRFGDPFTLRLAGLAPLVFTSDPAEVRRVLLDNGTELLAGEGNAPLRAVLGANSLLLLDGTRHMSQRRALLPLFHGERMRAYANSIRNVTRAELRGWREGATLPVHPAMQSVSMRIITSAVFGITEESRTEHCIEVLTRFMSCLSGSLVYLPALQRELGGFGPWSRFRRAWDDLAALLDREIDERRARGDLEGREDILGLLAAAHDDEGQALPTILVRDQLITLLAAGHETTATALVWALRHLLAAPEVEARLRSEIDAAGPTPSAEELNALPFLDAVCRETLRVFPVVPVIGRTVRERFEISGHALGPGTIVIPCIYLIHRRPEIYPDPARFDPTRFLSGSPGPHEYLPFGGGIRRCIGANFALYEMKLVLATIVAAVRLRLDRDLSPRASRRNVTLYPREVVRVRVVERRAGGGLLGMEGNGE